MRPDPLAVWCAFLELGSILCGSGFGRVMAGDTPRKAGGGMGDVENERGGLDEAIVGSTGAEMSDIWAVVQSVMRESYLDSTEDLRRYAEKVRYSNEVKRSIRSYLTALRQKKAEIMGAARERGIEMCRPDPGDRDALAGLIAGLASAFEVGQVGYECCLPDRVPPEGTTTMEGIDAAIAHWEGQLNSVGDDSQLANIDLQNVLQKQQQALQMMSQISKVLHDTAMAVIRKIG